MSTLLLDALAEAFLRSAAAAALVALVLTVCRVRDATVRHAAWTVVVCAMLLMPALPKLVPRRLAIQLPFTMSGQDLLERDANRDGRGEPDVPRDAAGTTSVRGTPSRGEQDELLTRTREPAHDAGLRRSPDADKRVDSVEREARDGPRVGGAVRRGAQTVPGVLSGTGRLRSRPADPTPLGRSSGSRSAYREFAYPVLGLIYVAIAFAMLVRCGVAWRRVSRIVRASRPVDAAVGSPRESTHVATPVTVGVVRPAVLLPASWRTWSDDALRSVLAHERAHAARRDPLVRLIAHVNCCLFWFDPVAWWLARALAVEAEHACDAAAIRAGAAPRDYAALLVDMARTVGARRGRLSWHAVGIGGRVLDERIDRVLSSDPPSPTRARRSIVGALCVAAVAVVVACRPQSRVAAGYAPIEQRDRALRVTLERIDRNIRGDYRHVDWDITPARIAALEDAVRADREDVDALEQLLIAYWVRPPARVETRRAAILWLIEHHPESPLASSVVARLFPRTLDVAQSPALAGDPVGYDLAKRAWLAHINRPDAGRATLDNASYFFATEDAPLAEALLQRAQARDGQGNAPTSSAAHERAQLATADDPRGIYWSARLGALYAGVLSRTLAPSGRNAARMIGRGAPRSPFAALVRAKLGESTDDVLLTAVGWFLARAGRGWPNDDIDPAFWAEDCLKRAVRVNPGAVLAHTMLLTIGRQPDRGEPLWRVPPALMYASVSTLPEPERFTRLGAHAATAYRRLEDLARWQDDPIVRERMTTARDEARRYAEDALRLASKYKSDPAYGTVMYQANMTLAALAVREGYTDRAARFLRCASESPVSEELAYSDRIVRDWRRQVHALLQRGQRAAVVAFSDRMADINIPDRIELREAAAAIRRGEPARYYEGPAPPSEPASR